MLLLALKTFQHLELSNEKCLALCAHRKVKDSVGHIFNYTVRRPVAYWTRSFPESSTFHTAALVPYGNSLKQDIIDYVGEGRNVGRKRGLVNPKEGKTLF